VRAVIHNLSADGFDSLYPRHKGGRPPVFSPGQRREIKRLALRRPVDHDLPFSARSIAKLAEFVVRRGVVDDSSHEALRLLLHNEGVSFQKIKTWTASNDPDFGVTKNRVLHLYDIADAKAASDPGDPAVVICMDEFGPLNLHPCQAASPDPVAASPCTCRSVALGGAVRERPDPSAGLAGSGKFQKSARKSGGVRFRCRSPPRSGDLSHQPQPASPH
jgi:transposase